jgi:glycosyltransferase involved in cell wall biosynthesis
MLGFNVLGSHSEPVIGPNIPRSQDPKIGHFNGALVTVGIPRRSRTVAIVLPTHNRSHLVGRAIKSVLAQTHTAWELLVVDDGSTDSTRDVIAGFHDPRIRYLRNEQPSGPSGARNTGILAAPPSDFLAFLDDDDEWLPRKLELQLDVFETSPVPLAAVGCGRIEYSGGEPEIHVPQYRGEVFEHLLARRARGYGAQLIVVRRQPGVKDLLFDTDLRCLEDLDYSMRLARLAQFDYVPEPLARLYRDYGGTHAWNAEAAIRGYEQLERKHERELDSRPSVRSYYYVCMAHNLAKLRRMRECRQRLRQALPGSRERLRLFSWYAAALIGTVAVRAVARFLPIRPPKESPAPPRAN